ncbi:CpaD family pilus assembly protein [Beijerinckia sp. L45]|uniref:CpaD family pilus assembly protein n=1 Tax=Beijerinckia sp. L45 TaxID=1641855 RepID=UPI00131B2394|nr:CpaD family pilus assembly protein [Beijerinckia sp. L45]
MRPDQTSPFQSPKPMRRRASGVAKAVFGVLMLAPLAGCGTSDRMKMSAIANDDYRLRHPIVLAKESVSIDIFPSLAAGGLDRHSAKQVASFAEEYRQGGRGPILVLVPRGPGQGESRGMVAGIRRAFESGGVRAAIDVTTYPIGNQNLSSPVRLSFAGLKAKVGDQCGQWPSDLASGSTIDEWQNRPYYNFGCSTQSMIAAQTADPRDLVGPRGEDASDTLIQSRAIENVRKGIDPSTTWTVHNTSIGTVGGS